MLEAALCACGVSGTDSYTIDRARVLVQITHPRDRASRRCSGIFRLLLRRTIAFAHPHSKGLEWIGMSVSLWRHLSSMSRVRVVRGFQGRQYQQLRLDRSANEVIVLNAHVCSWSFATAAISFEVGYCNFMR